MEEKKGISENINIEDGLGLEEGLSEDLSLESDLVEEGEAVLQTDRVVEELKSNNDFHIITAAMFGVNAATGSSQIFTSQFMPEPQIEKRPFTEQEIEKWEWLLTGVEVHKTMVSLTEKKDQLSVALMENNKYIGLARSQRRELKEKIEEVNKEIFAINYIYERALKGNFIMSLEEASPAQRESYLRTAPNKLSELEFKRAGLERQYESLENKINLDVEKGNALKESIRKIIGVDQEEMTNAINDEIKKKFDSAARITECEFLMDFRSKPIYLQCECGAISNFSIDSLPYYVGGDLYNDFSSRKRIDKEARRNKMSGRHNAYKLPYSDVKEFIFSRIRVPHIECEKCKRKLLLPYETIESLAEYGHLNDEWLLTEFESGKTPDFSQHASIDFGRRIQEYKRAVTGDNLFKVVSPINVNDAKAKKIKLSALSFSDLSRVSDLPTSEIGKLVMEKYAKYSSDPNSYSAVNEEFEGHVYLLIEAVRSMLKDNQVGSFVHGCSALLYLYGIENRLTGSELKQLVYGSSKNLESLKMQLFEFSVDNFLDSITSSKPFFLFENDRLRPVVAHNSVLPHTTFVECYRPMIRKYMIEKLTSLEPGEFAKMQDLFRRFSPIKSSFSFDEAVKKSDELVTELKRELVKNNHPENCSSCSSPLNIIKNSSTVICSNPECENHREIPADSMFLDLYNWYTRDTRNIVKNTYEGYQFSWFNDMWYLSGMAKGDEKKIPASRQVVAKKDIISNITGGVKAVKENEKKELDSLLNVISSDPHDFVAEVVQGEIEVSDAKKSLDLRDAEEMAKAREILRSGDYYAKKYFDDGEGVEKLGVFRKGSEEVPYLELMNMMDDDPRLKEDPAVKAEYEKFKEEFQIEDISYEDFQAQQSKRLDDIFS